MTMPGRPRPRGALLGRESIPPQGARIWLVSRYFPYLSIVEAVLDERCNECSDHPRMFGARVQNSEGRLADRLGPQTYSWRDYNVIPNSYNDHYAFTDEALARRYYEEP